MRRPYLGERRTDIYIEVTTPVSAKAVVVATGAKRYQFAVAQTGASGAPVAVMLRATQKSGWARVYGVVPVNVAPQPGQDAAAPVRVDCVVKG